MENYKTDILIIGAGPAGLACAYELLKANRDFIIIEKESAVGGLAKTYEFKEDEMIFRTDNGPHRFYSKNAELYRFIEELLGDRWIKVNRQTRQYIAGKFYNYPVKPSQALKNIGWLKASRMFLDYLIARIVYGLFGKKIVNFEDYVIANFGKSLGNFNMINYTEKIWGMPVNKIHSDWAGQRIKGLNLMSLAKDSLAKLIKYGNASKPKTLADAFYYPQLGTGLIYETIASKIRDKGRNIFFRTKPLEIHHQIGTANKAILVSDNKEIEIKFNVLVESVGMKDFIKLLRPEPDKYILDLNEKLKYASQVYLFITLNKNRITNDQWIYFPTKEIPFARIAEMKNFSKLMAPENKTSLFCEFFCSENDEIWNMPKEKLFSLAIESFRNLNFFQENEVRKYYVLRQKNVYPIYDVNYLEYLEPIKDYLNKFSNIYYIGRPGRFRYNNQDHSLEMGILAARSIIDGRKYDIESVGEEKEYFESGAMPKDKTAKN